jgi:Skp family chaperone for outer membrane proteins
MYRVAIATCVLLGLLAVPVAHAVEGVTIAVVDVARVSNESKYKAYYEQELEELIGVKRQEGREITQAVRAQFDEFEKERLLLTDAAREERQRELRAEADKVRDFDTQAKKEVQERGRAFSEELGENIKAVIKEVAEEHDVDLVFDSGVLLYQKDLPDLTDEVIVRLNEMFDEEHGAAEIEEEETTPAESDEGG